MSQNIEEKVDIAIITIIPEEFNAVRSLLTNPIFIQGPADQPNLYAWEVGTISSAIPKKFYKIVLAMAGRAGNTLASQVVSATIRRWEPRYVILVGVAGGFQKENLSKGDVVVSEVIWAYEYGKIGEKFTPRMDFVYQVDTSLLTAAIRVSVTNNDWKNITEKPPMDMIPKVLKGPIASGDKVVDDISNEFFNEVIKAWPKLIAVEMEGAGAAASIQQAQAEGRSVGFLMIRGISDMPIASSAVSENEQPQEDSSQTEQRDNWKPFAAAVAASFTRCLISNGWPVEPLSNVSDKDNQSSNIPASKNTKIATMMMKEKDFWNELYSISTQLYSTGPKERSIWERAGGNLSTIDTQSIGQDSWYKALQLLRNGGGGTEINPSALIKIMLYDFPNNEELKDLVKKGGICMGP